MLISSASISDRPDSTRHASGTKPSGTNIVWLISAWAAVKHTSNFVDTGQLD
jgi:hypothetical protein